jgi:CRISPR-associated protein Cas1
MARDIVRGKLRNQLTLLKRVYRTYKPPELVKIIRDFQVLTRQFGNAATVNQVRGYEGKGSALFFRGFPLGFRNRQDFKKRTRRPPTDPVNAVLSLCYTLLMNRVYGAVLSCGLDPHVGSLHALEYGRPSLALDLMEEFRTIIVDTLTLSIFNLKILNSGDFYLWSPPAEDPELKNGTLPDITKDPIGMINTGPHDSGDAAEIPDLEEEISSEKALKKEKVMPVRLKEDALKKLLQQFERKLKTRFHYNILNRTVDYERVILEQVRLYVKVIKGERDTYIPLQLQ